MINVEDEAGAAIADTLAQVGPRLSGSALTVS